MNGAEKEGNSMELEKDGRFKFISSSPIKYITKAGRTNVCLWNTYKVPYTVCQTLSKNLTNMNVFDSHINPRS